MKYSIGFLLLGLCVACIVDQTGCAKILVVIPTASYSHQIPFRKLIVQLVERGHEVTYVTTNPIEHRSPNFTQINISSSYKALAPMDYIDLRMNGVSWLRFIHEIAHGAIEEFADVVFNHTDVKKLYAPETRASFDLVMVEVLYEPGVFAFGHIFNAPLIGLSSLPLSAIHELNIGGMLLPSHEGTWEMGANVGPNLSFFRRMWNMVTLWKHMYLYYYSQFPRLQQRLSQYIGTVPPLMDIAKNVSVIFVQQSDVFAAARPKLPNVILFTANHIEENPPPLPEDLQKFLDGATNGFIYFSLGTNVKSFGYTPEIRRVLLNAFAKLPYRIVWKFEEELPNKPANVYTDKWFSQQRILAHPNIKLYMYQGGAQSTDEAIHFSVPVIGFPILADQDYQISRIVAHGVGKKLELLTVTADEVISTIEEVISDKRYKENMRNLKKLVNDVPYNVAENLVWWTEHVIRTKGAKYLRSTLADQPWYRHGDMDVIAFLGIAAFVMATIVLGFAVKISLYLYKWFRVAGTKKQKAS